MPSSHQPLNIPSTCPCSHVETCFSATQRSTITTSPQPRIFVTDKHNLTQGRSSAHRHHCAITPFSTLPALSSATSTILAMIPNRYKGLPLAHLDEQKLHACLLDWKDNAEPRSSDLLTCSSKLSLRPRLGPVASWLNVQIRNFRSVLDYYAVHVPGRGVQSSRTLDRSHAPQG